MERAVPRVQAIREVPVKNVLVGKGQVRVRSVDKEMDELTESIRLHGLLEPIVVCPTDQPGHFEVLMGQRRLTAHRRLGREKILAVIIDEPVDEPTAKTLSLSENLVRRDLDSRDVIDACSALYKKYGSARAVAEETGLPYAAVLKHIKYERLTPSLRAAVDTGEVRLDVALKAQDATFDDASDEADGLAVARALSGMTGVQQRQLLDARRRKPSEAITDLLAHVNAIPRKHQIIVTLSAEDHRALQLYAMSLKVTQDRAAARLVADGLRLAQDGKPGQS